MLGLSQQIAFTIKLSIFLFWFLETHNDCFSKMLANQFSFLILRLLSIFFNVLLNVSSRCWPFLSGVGRLEGRQKRVATWWVGLCGRHCPGACPPGPLSPGSVSLSFLPRGPEPGPKRSCSPRAEPVDRVGARPTALTTRAPVVRRGGDVRGEGSQDLSSLVRRPSC